MEPERQAQGHQAHLADQADQAPEEEPARQAQRELVQVFGPILLFAVLGSVLLWLAALAGVQRPALLFFFALLVGLAIAAILLARFRRRG